LVVAWSKPLLETSHDNWEGRLGKGGSGVKGAATEANVVWAGRGAGCQEATARGKGGEQGPAAAQSVTRPEASPRKAFHRCGPTKYLLGEGWKGVGSQSETVYTSLASYADSSRRVTVLSSARLSLFRLPRPEAARAIQSSQNRLFLLLNPQRNLSPQRSPVASTLSSPRLSLLADFAESKTRR
jgi:hypothetical protein